MESSRDIFILMTVAVMVGSVCYWYLVDDIWDSAKYLIEMHKTVPTTK